MECTAGFSRATEEILNTILEKPVTVGDSFTCTAPVDVMEVVVILGLTGDMEGRVLLECSEQTALKIVEAMNFGEAFETLEPMARATLNELGNLVAGRALTLFNDAGGRLSMTPPMLLCGVGMRASDRAPVHVIPVETEHGPMRVNLSVKSRNGVRA